MKGRKRGFEDIPSFFKWFSETDSNSDPIAEIIKDDIWPNPLQFFLVSLRNKNNNIIMGYLCTIESYVASAVLDKTGLMKLQHSNLISIFQLCNGCDLSYACWDTLSAHHNWHDALCLQGSGELNETYDEEEEEEGEGEEEELDDEEDEDEPVS